MDSKDKVSYVVPPNMGEKFLIFGMTVPELCIVVILVFVFVKELTLGRPLFFLLPCVAGTLFVRAMENGKNSLQILTTELKYYTAPKCYSFRGEDYANDPDNR